MNNNVTLVVPQYVVDAIHLAERDWIPFVGTILLALVVIAATAFVKGHVNVKREEALAKAAVIRFTALFSVLLSVVASLGYFITNNMPVLRNLPYVGEYMGTVLGVVWAIYQAGVKFKSVEAKAASWATPKSQTTTETQTPAPQVAPEGSFL